MERVLYDGSSTSVERIMDLIGTKGVNNCYYNINNRLVTLPHGELAREGDSVVVEDGFFWVETKKWKTTKKPLDD